MGELVWKWVGDWASVAQDELLAWWGRDGCSSQAGGNLRGVRTGLTSDVYGMSRGTGAKCAGRIDEEYLGEKVNEIRRSGR